MTDTDQDGSNLTQLKQDIAEGIARIEQHKAERSSCNEEISAIRETLAAKGIPKKALDMAMKYKDMDPRDRVGFDAAYDIVREAIGLPVVERQGDLFAQTDQGQDEDITGKLDEDGADVIPLNNSGDEEPDPDQEEFDAEVDKAMGEG